MHTTRRSFLVGCGAALIWSRSAAVRAHNNAGVVTPPVAPPPVALDLHDGSHSTLAKLLRGKVTALQMMFTSC